MKYYDIALPVRLPKLFGYKSSEEIIKGCRVLVSFGNSFHTGIVWQETKTVDSTLQYKGILEVVDEQPKIAAQLLDLADWISKYYHCSLGQALSAMLPSAFNIQLQQQVRLLEKKQIPESDGIPEMIFNELSSLNWQNITDVKTNLNTKSSRLNYWLEYLEINQIIEIKRVYDAKIKKKVANFVVRNKIVELPKLTERQADAWQIILTKEASFPLKDIIHETTRPVLKALEKKGMIRIEPQELNETYFVLPSSRQEKIVNLSEEQKTAVSSIIDSVEKHEFNTFLLHGITGSGKTEVYIRAIKKCRDLGRSALMLVPEISLTPQMVERFFNAFGENIAILHSHLNDRQRWEQWNKIKSGECKIVIGARSAIFAPLENIGTIIVDEEHETTYKQDKTPRYNGRDIAVVRARMSNAVVVLGSATPSLESWLNNINGKYELLTLTHRPLSYNLPTVKIVDMRNEVDHKQLLSKTLRAKIEEKLEAKEQIILLQNRRGHSSFVQCISCGKLFSCPHCDISLNFHSHQQELLCHYCGHKINMPRKCPECGSYMFSFGAAGTQQIEKILQIMFPGARILRMDSDSARKKDSYDSMFERMKSGNVDILLGTQMIAKGLDFANVTLVGVISADISLNVPDFRAAEKTFQLLTQVAGRSGRGEKPGEVIIQTYNPDHYSITTATKQHYETFAAKELILRKALKYPPDFKIARFVFAHKTEKILKEQTAKAIPILGNLRNTYPPKQLLILGPVPAPMVKLQNNFRYHIIIKADSYKLISHVVSMLNEHLKLSSSVKTSIDIDPYNLM
jgi:primosomal protein N' (replication factor Y) (superfamily II helicase)